MKSNENIERAFGKWHRHFLPFIESDKFDKIFQVLKDRKGKVNTAPHSSDLFRAFSTCDPDNLRVILVGICPYHTFIDKKPIADGLMMSSKHTGRVQPSLWNMYAEWERVYSDSIDPDMWHNADLEYLSKQGVLLYNVALTVQESKALSDNEIWSEFNRFFWEEIISKSFSGICIVFMGAAAHKSAAYINPLQHYHWCISHPASAAHNGSNVWSSEGVFKKIDEIITQNNGPEYVIKWYGKKEMIESTYPKWVTESIKEQEEQLTAGEKRAILDKVEESMLPWESGIIQEGIKKK